MKQKKGTAQRFRCRMIACAENGEQVTVQPDIFEFEGCSPKLNRLEDALQELPGFPVAGNDSALGKQANIFGLRPCLSPKRHPKVSRVNRDDIAAIRTRNSTKTLF